MLFNFRKGAIWGGLLGCIFMGASGGAMEEKQIVEIEISQKPSYESIRESNETKVGDELQKEEEETLFFSYKEKNKDGESKFLKFCDILKFINESSCLVELDLSECFWGTKDTLILPQVLSRGSSLKKLQLRENEIGDEGAQVIAKALEVTTSLKKLDLDWNQIGDEGAQVIAKALEVNTSLKKLSLDQNKIGNKGAQALGEVLKKSTTLQELRLDDNPIGNEGGKFLLESLIFHWKSFRKIPKIWVDSNEIEYDIQRYLNKFLKLSKKQTDEEEYVLDDQVVDAFIEEIGSPKKPSYENIRGENKTPGEKVKGE